MSEGRSASRSSSIESTPTTPGTGLLMRLFWMVFGNIALLGAGGLLLKDDGEQLLELSIVYWLLVGAIVAARYLDIRRYGGRTAEGEPANLTHLRRHAAILVPVAALVWVVAAFA